jgi:dihydroorotase
MNVLLRSITIMHKASPYHLQKVDMLLRNGIIERISQAGEGGDFEDETRVLDADGKYISAGWFDMQAHFGDPGQEQKEDIFTGAAAAAAGGFTGVALLSNTQPVVQTKNDIHYLKQDNAQPLELYPMAAVTRDTQGKELTEMIDLARAGAVAFSDGIHPLWHTQVMLKALQYMQKLDTLLINRPEDQHLACFGDMHEGLQSTILGLKGIPVLAETIAIERDLRLLEYVTEFTVGALPRLHFSNISSKASVSLIKHAKQEGLPVSCDVAAHHLAFTDEDLADFDTNLRVNPPLRTRDDQWALHEGLREGTIDVIVSSHQPHDEEQKKCEFDLAAFGMIGLQTVYPVINQALSRKLPMEDLLEKISTVPRSLLGIDSPEIREGALAELTLFDPDANWVLDHHTNRSRSRNSPFWGKELKGRVCGTFYRDRYWTDLS